jgi:hypothetical protein
MKITAVLAFTLLSLTWTATLHADRRFQATLTGAQQVPVVASNGTGIGTVVLNSAETQITVNLTFSGLTSNANAAHIHGPGAAGTNAGVLFDFSGVTPVATSGTIPQQTFAITPTQVTQLKAGQYYFNIHTGNFGGGEIRGQILTAPPQSTRPRSAARSRCRLSSAAEPEAARSCSTPPRIRSSST